MITNIPLMLMEREIMEVQKVDTTFPGFNLGSIEEIRGDLNIELLKLSLKKTMSEEEIFSFGFIENKHEYIRTLNKFNQPKIYYHDLSDLNKENTTKEVKSILKHNIQQPFPLDTPPLHRFIIIKHHNKKYTLAHVWHHMIMDGMGFNLFHRKILETYNNKNYIPDTNPLSIKDIAIKEQSYWHSNRKKRDEIFWSNFNEQPKELLQPKYKLSSNETTYRTELPISNKVWNALNSQIQDLNCTPQHILLLAAQLCFSDAQGRHGITIGRPTHRRTDKYTKTKMGHFAGLSLVWLSNPGHASLKDAINNIKLQLKKDVRHQRYPVSKLSRDFNFTRNIEQQIFDIMFSYEPMKFICNYGAASGELHALCHMHEQSPAAIYVRDYYTDSPPILDFQLNLKYFSDKECLQTIERFQLILDQLINKNKTLNEIDFLTQYDKKIYKSINCDEGFTKKSLIEKIEEHSILKPDNIAVVDESGNQLTYFQLYNKISLRANQLSSLGILHNDSVGLLIKKNIELLILMLAINKIGANYTPISNQQPILRIQSIINELSPKLVIAPDEMIIDEKPINTKIVSIEYIKKIKCDHRTSIINYHDNYNAYILFTSGSTGKPKGVVISASARDHFLAAICQKLQLTEQCYIPALTAPTFDISVLELFAPLYIGGKVLILSEMTSQNPRILKTHLQHHEITHLQATPTAWSMLIESDWNPQYSIEALIGGEAVPTQLINQLSTRNIKCWNLYGPTESTVWVMALATNAKQSITSTSHIGGLLSGCYATVCDIYQRPLPINAPGELIISGETLAEEYLKQPELTTKAFITLDGQRSYKTGDLVSLTMHGHFNFHGRIDNQCKIRGYRIELGEIENILLKLDSIYNCAVVISNNNDTSLIGYYQSQTDIKNLHLYLATKLPNYMIPSHFINAKSWPMTSSGKTDRKQLLHLWETEQPEQPLCNLDNVSELISAVWQKLLTRSVPINANFFEVGGNSVIAMKLLSQIEQNLMITLEGTFVFEHPTQKAMIEAINTQISPKISTLTNKITKQRITPRKRKKNTEVTAL